MNSFLTQLSAMDFGVIISLALGVVFKDQLVKYFGTYIADIGMYRTRRYDNDNNPGTGQWCTVTNPATGVNDIAYVEKYTAPHVFPSKRLVFVWFYFNESHTMMYCVPMSYSAWRTKSTGRLPVLMSDLSFTTNA